MEQPNGIPHVVHFDVCRTGQRLEVSLHCLRKRRRSLPHPVPDCPVFGWKATLLLGTLRGAVLQLWRGQSVEAFPYVFRYIVG